MTQTPHTEGELSALMVLLRDLQRAGVRDVVADIPFSYVDDVIESPLLGAASTLTQKSPSPSLSSPSVSPAPTKRPVPVQVEPAEKPVKEVMYPPEELAWVSQKGGSVCVVVGTPCHKGEEPLKTEADLLLKKMLASIGLKEADYTVIALKEAAAHETALSPTVCAQAKVRVETLLDKTHTHLLIVGQEACRTLLGEGMTLSKARKTGHVVAQLPAFTVPHPNVLLEQPVLKKMAWQDLLRCADVLPEAVS